MTLTNNTYYRYIFYARAGQRLAFAFCPTLGVASLPGRIVPQVGSQDL